MVSGRWAESTRKWQLPPDWPERRQAVRLRAGGRCEAVADGRRCPQVGTDCDHIRRGHDHSLTNLQWLCTTHHRSKSGREGAAAQPPLRRPPETHPAFD
jgi:5-methylcytosine-specific restriction enzyme A